MHSYRGYSVTTLGLALQVLSLETSCCVAFDDMYLQIEMGARITASEDSREIVKRRLVEQCNHIP